jgi:hypothetical protein
MAGAFDDAWTLAQLRLGMGGNVEALDALWEISSSAAAAPFLVAHGLVVVGLNVLLAPEAGDRRRELVLGTLANAASHRCDGRLTLEIDGDVEVSAALRVEVSRLWVASSSVAVLTQCSRLVATALLTPKRQPSHPWLAPWASVASADAAAAIPNKPCAEKLLWLIAHAHDVELLAQCFALVRGVLWAAADGCALLGELLELLVSDEVGRGAIGWAALERDGGSLASALGVLDAIAAGDGSGGAPSPVLQALLPGGDLSSHVVALLSQVWRNAQREEHAIRAATLLWQLRADGEALLRQSGHGTPTAAPLASRIVALLPLAFEPRSSESTAIVALLSLGASLFEAAVAQGGAVGSAGNALHLDVAALASWAADAGGGAECAATRRALLRFLSAVLGLLRRSPERREHGDVRSLERARVRLQGRSERRVAVVAGGADRTLFE